MPACKPLLGAGCLTLLLLIAGCTSSPNAGLPGEEGWDDDGNGDPGSANQSDGGHIHDYWDDETTKTLMSGSVPVMVFHNHLFDEPPREQHTHGCEETLLSTSQGGSVKFSFREPRIVPPGTASLEMTFKWSTPAITGLRLIYRPANLHAFKDGGILENDKALRLSLTPRMADAGHATRSQWAFFLCADSTGTADLAHGDVTATIIAHRADELLPDPPHPDHWNNRTSVEVARRAWNGEAITYLNKGEGWLQIPMAPRSTIPDPAETVWVNVSFTSHGIMSQIDPGAVLLYYRDSTVPDWIYKTAEPSSSSTGSVTFQLEVEENMWDGVYSNESNWDFWLRIASQTRTGTPLGLGQWSVPHQFAGDVSATVAVIRPPEPEE